MAPDGIGPVGVLLDVVEILAMNAGVDARLNSRSARARPGHALEDGLGEVPQTGAEIGR